MLLVSRSTVTKFWSKCILYDFLLDTTLILLLNTTQHGIIND